MAGRGPTEADKKLAKLTGENPRAVERWRQAGLLRTLGGRGVPVTYPEDAATTARCIASVLATPGFRCLHAAALVSFLRGHAPSDRALRGKKKGAYPVEFAAFVAGLERAAGQDATIDNPLNVAKHAARHFSRRGGDLGTTMRDRLGEAGTVSLPAALENVLGIMLGVQDLTPEALVLAGFGSLTFALPKIRQYTGPSMLDAFEQAIDKAAWDDLVLARDDAHQLYESTRQLADLFGLGLELPRIGEDVSLDFALALFAVPGALLLRGDLGNGTFEQMATTVQDGSFGMVVEAALSSEQSEEAIPPAM